MRIAKETRIVQARLAVTPIAPLNTTTINTADGATSGPHELLRDSVREPSARGVRLFGDCQLLRVCGLIAVLTTGAFLSDFMTRLVGAGILRAGHHIILL